MHIITLVCPIFSAEKLTLAGGEPIDKTIFYWRDRVAAGSVRKALAIAPAAADARIAALGLKRTAAEVVLLPPNSGWVEVTYELGGSAPVDRAQFSRIHAELCAIRDAAISQLDDRSAMVDEPLLREALAQLGKHAKFHESYTINLITTQGQVFDDNAYDGLVQSTYQMSEFEAREGDLAALSKVAIGETGVAVLMRDINLAPHVRFWIARLIHAQDAYQAAAGDIIALEGDFLRGGKPIAGDAWERFIRRKQNLIRFIYQIAPSTNCWGGIDSAIYQGGYSAWDIDAGKVWALEILDRFEGIAKNYEDKRAAFRAERVSLIVNLLAFAGIGGLLDYLYHFADRHLVQEKTLLDKADLWVAPSIAAVVLLGLVIMTRRTR